MGKLLDDVAEACYHTPRPEIIPELFLLGTLEHQELSLENGTCIHVDLITYEGRTYLMKATHSGRWRDRRRGE